MPIIGNPIYQSAFVVDQFSGNGSTVAFTMSVAPAGVTNVLVAVSGVLQDPSTYGVVGNTITFSAAPPSGTGNISCRYLGVPVTGVTTTAYRTVTEFTATAGQTTFTPPSYSVGFINVYLNGVLLGSADYTATNGTTVVLATGASAGNLLTVESFLISSVANAIANAAGSVSSTNLATNSVTTDKIAPGAVIPADLSTGGPYWDTSSNLGIGTTSPTARLGIPVPNYTASATSGMIRFQNPDVAADSCVQSYYVTGAGSDLFIGANSYINTGGSTTRFSNSYASSAINIRRDGEIGFQTNTSAGVALIRMNINSAGQVTMPYQPAFRAFTGTSFTGSTVVIFGSTQFNTGGHYSTSTGRFTAPIAGRYFFTFYLLSAGGYSGSFWGGLRRNGTSLAFAEIDWPGNYRTIATSTVVQLAAGDYVDVLIAQGDTYAGGGSVGEWNAFSGYLLG